MINNVSLEDKKDFLRWFLNSYKLKRRECGYILNYLMSNDKLMNNIHFVEHAEYCNRGIVISTICVDSVPFRYYKNNIMTTDAEKTFHDIRLNRDQEYYIQLNFNNNFSSDKYLGILEENSFIPNNLIINEKDEIMAEKLLEHSLKLFKRDSIMKLVDESLDNRDIERFNELVNLLKDIE